MRFMTGPKRHLTIPDPENGSTTVTLGLSAAYSCFGLD